MAGTLILHDTRLHGYPAASSADVIVTVNRAIALGRALTRIGDEANARGGLDSLSIMCHGFERVYSSPTERRSLMIGGTGLQLCREGLRHGNVAGTAVLNGFVSEIIVYACAAADTHPDMAGTNWDGRRLFGEMAIHTGAVVYAADATQYYWRRHRASPNMCTDVIDFGRWEGNLLRFTPDGAPPTVVVSNPRR